MTMSRAIVAGVLVLAPWRAAVGQADSVPPPGVTEQPMTFTSGTLQLAGTLTLPDGVERPPIAVIVAGSGPTDRNGNQGAQLRTNTYAQLAWGLAEQGVASLRYDKRVLPATRGQVNLPALSFDDFVADLAAAVLAVREDYAKVFVLGHSEGGSLAIRAASRGTPMDGVILVSTPGRNMVTLLHEQLSRQLDAATLTQFDTALARFLRGEDPGELLPALRPLVAPVNRRFMQGWASLDPTEELALVRVPVLIVQGDMDIQIRPADAEALKAAKPDAQLLIVPGASHTLKAVSDTLMGTQLPTYTDPTLPLVPGIVDSVAAFVKGVVGGN
ncbi:MAG: lysophospholipase [Gemmatimonadota bacterium]|nr:lysophospholipase [Gemmatimonadota bacterium]